MRPALTWLIDNYPEELPMSICHGDLHFSNVLLKDNQVAGVLDWSFRIDNALFDVATTAILTKYLGPMVLSDYDWSRFVKRFIEEYAALMPLDEKTLRYFYAMKIFFIWMDVENGVDAWLFPGVQEGISDLFYDISGVRVTRFVTH